MTVIIMTNKSLYSIPTNYFLAQVLMFSILFIGLFHAQSSTHVLRVSHVMDFAHFKGRLKKGN